MIDAALNGATARAYAQGFGLTRPDMAWAWSQYLPDGADATDPALSPLYAPEAELRRLPPALLVLLELDPARDDGERLAARLRQAGVATVVSRYPGTVHNFTLMANWAEPGFAAVEEIARFAAGLVGPPTLP